jgi:hypothetical protein
MIIMFLSPLGFQTQVGWMEGRKVGRKEAEGRKETERRKEGRKEGRKAHTYRLVPHFSSRVVPMRN